MSSVWTLATTLPLSPAASVVPPLQPVNHSLTDVRCVEAEKHVKHAGLGLQHRSPSFLHKMNPGGPDLWTSVSHIYSTWTCQVTSEKPWSEWTGSSELWFLFVVFYFHFTLSSWESQKQCWLRWTTSCLRTNRVSRMWVGGLDLDTVYFQSDWLVPLLLMLTLLAHTFIADANSVSINN